MPAKRRISDLLEAYHRGKGNFSREDGWRQFLENASRPALLSVLSALLATLPDPRRKDLEHYLAISEPALRDLVAPKDQPQLEKLRKIATDIAKGNQRVLPSAGGCDEIVLLKHLEIIEEVLACFPGRGRNSVHTKLWLKERMTPLFDRLASIPCTLRHPQYHVTERDLSSWAAHRGEKIPLAEHLLASQHRKEPKTMHRLASAAYARRRYLVPESGEAK